jgi:hypothetical protein
MKEIFWKLVGADCFILSQSARESQKVFLALGMLYAFLSTITFISFFGLFLGVFQGLILSLVGASVFSFIISNLYRLVIITLEPSTLPLAKEHKAKFWAYFVRVGIVILLAMFISKVIETMLFGHWVDNLVEEKMRRDAGTGSFNQIDQSKFFVEHMKYLNLHYPQINLLTLFVVSLYGIPVIIKHRLKKEKQYYDLKRKIDKRIVEEEYQKMLSVKADLLENICFDNKRPYRYQKKYEDEPFNTLKIEKEQANNKSQNDFLTLFD